MRTNRVYTSVSKYKLTNLRSGGFFSWGKGKKERLIHLLHESSATPSLLTCLLCHAINVSQSDFTENSCGLLEGAKVTKRNEHVYFPGKGNSKLNCLCLNRQETKNSLKKIGGTSQSFI